MIEKEHLPCLLPIQVGCLDRWLQGCFNPEGTALLDLKEFWVSSQCGDQSTHSLSVVSVAEAAQVPEPLKKKVDILFCSPDVRG